MTDSIMPDPLVPIEVERCRKSISKRIRFEVFKRDGFTCQYCGSKPPGVVLELDHIYPVSKGGTNRRDNLITSCFGCNRGKADGLLSEIPQSVTDRGEMLKEKRDQLRAYERLLASIRADEESRIDLIAKAFALHFDGYTISDRFRESVRGFLQKMPVDVVEGAMHKACLKVRSRDDALRYFCGICYGIIRGGTLT